MEVRAKAKYIRIAPRKIRLVVDVIRGLGVEEALQQLAFSNKKSARSLLKLMNSAVANAEHNNELQKSNLYVKEITVNDGPTLNRWRPRAFGRAGRIRKRTSHLLLVLDEKIPSKKELKPRIAKKPASETTVKLDAAVGKVKSQTIDNGEVEEKPKTTDQTPEPVDVRMQAKHRNQQNQDKKNQKNKGFLKQVFRRKSGE